MVIINLGGSFSILFNAYGACCVVSNLGCQKVVSFGSFHSFYAFFSSRIYKLGARKSVQMSTSCNIVSIIYKILYLITMIIGIQDALCVTQMLHTY